MLCDATKERDDLAEHLYLHHVCTAVLEWARTGLIASCLQAFVGMANTRLNCYANATLQCLVAIPEFVDLFVSGEAQNGPGQPKRPVSKALAALLRSMQLGRGTVNPRK